MVNEWISDKDAYMPDIDRLEELIGNSRSTCIGKAIHVQVKHAADQDNEEYVAIYYDDHFLFNGSYINECARKMAPNAHWRNIMVAAGQIGPMGYPKQMRDVNVVDFKHVAKYFVRYGHAARQPVDNGKVLLFGTGEREDNVCGKD
jgi:hypothetical protein